MNIHKKKRKKKTHLFVCGECFCEIKLEKIYKTEMSALTTANRMRK